MCRYIDCPSGKYILYYLYFATNRAYEQFTDGLLYREKAMQPVRHLLHNIKCSYIYGQHTLCAQAYHAYFLHKQLPKSYLSLSQYLETFTCFDDLLRVLVTVARVYSQYQRRRLRYGGFDARKVMIRKGIDGEV